jgi:geranylgeranyl pyrophosphate synthase
LFAEAELQQEFAAVEEQLKVALAELRPPLDDLVRGQLAAAISPQRIGGVLAAGYPRSDTLQRRTGRILLAAAVEMLHLALRLHDRLVRRGGDLRAQGAEKAWVGSSILVGDYCFSRAAILAAQTNEPQVVTIFAQTLKQISESHLRQLFNADTYEFDEDEILVNAGLTAATLLAGLPVPERIATLNAGRGLLCAGDLALDGIPDNQRERWQAVRALVVATSPPA